MKWVRETTLSYEESTVAKNVVMMLGGPGSRHIRRIWKMITYSS
jgi:hypothetical protein